MENGRMTPEEFLDMCSKGSNLITCGGISCRNCKFKTFKLEECNRICEFLDSMMDLGNKIKEKELAEETARLEAEELAKKEVEEKARKESNEPQVGDIIEVTNSGRGYTTYTEFMENHAPELLELWRSGDMWYNGMCGEVVFKGLHDMRPYTGALLICKNDNNVFIIHEEGVKIIVKRR